MPRLQKHFIQDMTLIVMSVLCAIFIAKVGFSTYLIDSLNGYTYVAIFISGMFFTSAFTTPFAIVALGSLALEHNIFLVAVLGGLGALSGDYVMFRFIKDRVSEDFGYLLNLSKIKRLPHLFRTTAFQWFAPFLGALVIASPLPDEIGVAILGLSKLNTRVFVPISFLANSFGILLIGLVATKIVG